MPVCAQGTEGDLQKQLQEATAHAVSAEGRVGELEAALNLCRDQLTATTSQLNSHTEMCDALKHQVLVMEEM